jgi:beta-phosphoglucomutase-like phosphatase (HAD superfamily)
MSVIYESLYFFKGNVDAGNCIIFEDAPYGVAAAKNAGM